MIGKSFYAKCRVLGPRADHQRVASVTDQTAAAAAMISSMSEPMQQGQASSSSGYAPRVASVDQQRSRPILGPQSSVQTLRRRLKELKSLGVDEATIYGTKDQLYERLVRCEDILDEKMEVMKAHEERRRRRPRRGQNRTTQTPSQTHTIPQMRDLQ